jgi:hypothetical protein
MKSGMNNLKATAGTKLGGEKQRGSGGLKLYSDYKGAGKEMNKKAAKQSRKAV